MITPDSVPATSRKLLPLLTGGPKSPSSPGAGQRPRAGTGTGLDAAPRSEAGVESRSRADIGTGPDAAPRSEVGVESRPQADTGLRPRAGGSEAGVGAGPEACGPEACVGPGTEAGAGLYVLYRGPLASCNYDCPYCPFAKRVDPPELLRADRADLERFVGWVEETTDRRLSVLFTPWGEGLTRSWYRDAIVRLSHLPHVARVAIQTNLAARTGWLADANPQIAALWSTYHPGQITRARFLARCRELDALGIRYSVGVVGLPEHYDDAVALRDALPPSVYLWINAADGHSYTAAEEQRWTALDPRFGDSVRPHPSRGLPCHAGETAVSVLGDGTVRRCHFIPTPIGNLYDGSWRAALRPRPCTNDVCDCHIGYVHLKPLHLRDVYAAGLLERIPAAWPSPA